MSCSPCTQVASAKETGVTPDLLAAVEDKEAQRRKQRDAADARAKLLAEVGAANIDAVETLWADLFAHDAEYARLRAMPKMPDALDDFKKNFDAATAEFRENGLEKSARIEVGGGEGCAARSLSGPHASACNLSSCIWSSCCCTAAQAWKLNSRTAAWCGCRPTDVAASCVQFSMSARVRRWSGLFVRS
jgi:hypothetical protein